MSATVHTLILSALLISALALRVADSSRGLAPARWPAETEHGVYSADAWTAGPLHVQEVYTAEQTSAIVERTYVAPGDGQIAVLTVWTAPTPQARMLFRKGADRDFLGAGYTVHEVINDVVGNIPGGGALLAERGSRAWLLVYAFGERRGPLGAGPTAWAFAEWDALRDTPHDYYLARVAVPFRSDQPPPSKTAEHLAAQLFAHLSAWYSE